MRKGVSEMINIKKLIPAGLALAALTAPAAAMAETLVPSNLAPINNAIVVVKGIIRFILLVGFILAFIMLLVGGIRWILAGGDEKAVANARNTITASLIGLVIILVSFAIIRLVETFFNVTIISGDVTVPVFNQQ